jgi:hypothetical protein
MTDILTHCQTELYSALDINMGIIVACLPSMRPFLRMLVSTPLVSRLTNKSSDKSHGDKSGTCNSGDNSIGRAPYQENDITKSPTPRVTNDLEDGWDESPSASIGRLHGSDIELVHTRIGIAK